MKKDTIIFIGRPAMVRRFEKTLKRNFNIMLPESEIRIAKSNLVQVIYAVNHAKTPYFDSTQALNEIAEYAIQKEIEHNAYADNCYWYKITEG